MNYYRNIERNWELTANTTDLTITVPTLFLAGSRDVVIGGATQEALEGLMAPLIPDLRRVTLVPEKGHWIQQEDPAATNAALLDFLSGV